MAILRSACCECPSLDSFYQNSQVLNSANHANIGTKLSKATPLKIWNEKILERSLDWIVTCLRVSWTVPDITVREPWGHGTTHRLRGHLYGHGVFISTVVRSYL
jgi:hypothetical protein